MSNPAKVVRVLLAIAVLFVSVPLALTAEALALRHGWQTPGIFVGRHLLDAPVTDKLSAVGGAMAVWIVTDTLCYTVLLYGLVAVGKRIHQRLRHGAT
ncbi:MAG TPA: hypothetical protein VGF08_10535 [Terriglobales bacterium]|jgi:hypothetical protein